MRHIEVEVIGCVFMNNNYILIVYRTLLSNFLAPLRPILARGLPNITKSNL